MASIDFDVTCNACGAALETFESQGGIYVDPCKKCMQAADADSEERGYKAGYDKGYGDSERER